jgi:carbon-monoxide dehydrogenase medium subunit
VIPAPVRYARAADLEHALELLSDPDARALAGGQSLLPVMKLRIARPSLVVDISRLPLRGIELRETEVHLGPLTTWDELASAPELREPELVATAECAGEIGDLQVRNRGTIGGSLAHADPASDMAAVLLAFGATLVLHSPEGDRAMPLDDFLLGPFTTALDPQELIVDVTLPLPPAGSGSAYASIEHPASGFALAGAAALATPDGDTAIAVTGISDRPLPLPPNIQPEAALAKIDVFGDRVAPEEYRRHLATVVVGRALAAARARAKRDGA